MRRLSRLGACYDVGMSTLRPIHLDLKRDRGLTVHWSDGRISFYPIAYLRKWSPSAEVRQLREELAKNLLAVLPSSAVHTEPLTAVNLELVGNYAVRIIFSDGHDTGIYSWEYLREIDPSRNAVEHTQHEPPPG